MNRILAFFKNHPILSTLLQIAIVTLLLCIGLIFWLNSYTLHGQATIVPSVKYLSVPEATQILQRNGFRCEVIDSLIIDNVEPGVVVEQTPQANAKVKEGRIIYLTINAFTPKTIILPPIIDGSARQAQARLENMGFDHVTIQYEPSPYKDLVLDVKCDGRKVKSGDKLPAKARITLIVGSGENNMDSIPTESAAQNEVAITDDNWLN